MEELKKLGEALPDMSTDDILEKVPRVMELVKEIGFLEIVQDEDLKDLIPDMREKMGDIDLDKLVPLAKTMMPMMIEGMTELLMKSEEAQEELEDMEDVTVEVSIPEIDLYLHMTILDGKFDGGEGKLPDAELKLGMKKTAFLKMVTGEGDLVTSYMSGEVTLEGPLNKAMTLQSLMEILADEFDFDLGIM